ncbi:PD-(D/E)XK nuclease family protein [Pleurocapsales cyanobacterium LEGE 10410]|nr:PD-(D/E)XK nuclease family protein [Pleurocapsales cyanobacterium LEGE 10410]
MGKYIVPELSIVPDLQVITPSKAIAFSLKVPHYSLECLTQRLVRCQGMGIASTLLSRRLLQNAVAEVVDTKDVEGTAKAFLSTIKDLFRSGIDLATLQQNSDSRIQQLGNLASAYQKQLRQRNKIDAAELYWQGSIEVTHQQAYLFYGYFAPAKDELALINAIASQDSILVFPLDDLFSPNQQAVAWLQSQGWQLLTMQQGHTGGINRQLQQSFRQRATLPKGVSLDVFPTIEAEVRGTLTQVKILLTKGVAAKDIVLITKEEQLYGKALSDLAWEYNLPVQVAYEIPLEQTRIGAWLKLVLEVMRDNFPFEATAKLLSHPLSKYMSAEIWSAARQTHPQGLAAWSNLGVDLSLLDSANSDRRDLWIQRLQDILSAWDVLEKAKSWAREIAAYYRLQEALTELAKPKQKLSKRAFINEINDILALLTISAQPGIGGIQLHSPLSLLGTNYPHVFVLGSREGIFPAAIADDPILDFHNRKQLAKQGIEIETAVDLAQKETFYFYCLLGIPTQSITFSYPELIDRQPTLPSPYLTRLGLKPRLAQTLPLPSIELARQSYLRQSHQLEPEINSALLLPKITQAWQVEVQRESAIAPDLYDGVIGIKLDPQSKIFSASQLTQLGQCPFKWFSARLLKLKELVEAKTDLSAALRGSLYHRCLELSLENIYTASDLAEFNREQLAKAFATAEQELNLTQLPGWRAQRQEHLNLLLLNLTTTEFLPSETEVIARETKFATQWYGLPVQGQVDRIDRTSTGLTVIDYKTSGVIPAGVKDATGKANLDIQLAVYQDAVSEAMSEGLIVEQYADEPINTAAYYSITQQKTISRPQKDPEELAAFAERVKSHLQQGHYPVAPDVDRKACRYCAYDLVCRKGDRLSRKLNY